MIMLDKARTSVFIKVGAVILAILFVLGLMPLFNPSAAAEFFQSLFVSSKQPTEEQEIAKLKSIIKDDPDNVEALIDLGNAYFDRQSYEKAIEYYDRALKLKPNDVDVIVDKGVAYFELEQYDKALEQFRQATGEKPDHAKAWYNMGVVFKRQGDNINLEFAWSRYLELEPTGDRADEVRQELAQIQQQ